MSGARAVFTIAPGLPFVDALAAGLIARAGSDPAELARAQVLLPTRRACRALAEAFLRQGGGRPMLLPRLSPLGEVDAEELVLAGEGEPDAPGAVAAALPPAISPLRRQVLLARAVLAFGAGLSQGGGGPPTPDQAARLAGELGRFLDQVQTERLGFDALAGLVPEAYAEHWQVTLRFLRILTEHWPRILAEEGAMDPAERRNRLLAAEAEAWRARPPGHPVVVAGSTGSIPATADLIEAVARLPQGAVVLPGLDRTLSPEEGETLPESHPQFGLVRLVARLGVAPAEVADWEPGAVAAAGLAATPSARARLVAEALRPAEKTHLWQAAAVDAAAALDGVARIDCPGPQEEAGVIALVMREALAAEARTVALVTPDRGLARRVAAEMRRFRVEVDDSAGRPLAETPPGTFLRLTAALVAGGAAPLALLAALKHPFAAGGMEPGAFRAMVRRLERAILRGPRPAPGFAGLAAALDGLADGKEAAALKVWLAGIEAAAAGLGEAVRRPVAPLGELVRAHVAFAEALAADRERPGAARLWRGEAGEAANDFVFELARAADGFAPLAGRLYPAFLDTLMAGRVVRPRQSLHPRVHIWGALEARLQRADVMILGGLNEGTWPAEPAPDPWMSRPMRVAFGLPAPERRIGLSAHDFAQGFCARRVVLTRAIRAAGTPTVPSRWLLRLEALLKARGGGAFLAGGEEWLAWQRLLDRPDRLAPEPRPAPRPPLAARPRTLSVTQVEAWMRDPYAVYARHVLRLEPLDPLEADPGAAEYGSFIHRALDAFRAAHPDALPADALDRLLAMGRRAFGPALARPAVAAFWWPRFERIARWFLEREEERRPDLAGGATEAKGTLVLAGPGGPFTLTAKADRIDRLADGRLAIIDYKTGVPPKTDDMRLGFAPQLPLEGAIALAGGFPAVGRARLAELAFWRLGGGDPAGEIHRLAGEEAERMAAAARDGFARLIAAFDDPSVPYLCRPRPEAEPRYGDYLHLERIGEWSAGAGEGGE
ncbi:MAG: double-strand break repair protein AddB [Proteobacteria bacterium]|nr:double-strand break repair protein AddB [Pseudomonadota bacterium]